MLLILWIIIYIDEKRGYSKQASKGNEDESQRFTAFTTPL
jgi:hypothetical protein